jgi:hypothetical protein
LHRKLRKITAEPKRKIDHYRGEGMMRKFLIAVAGAALVSTAGAQAVDAVKESGKAAAESTKQGADETKGAMHSGPEKAVDKTKAQVHKAKAKYHRHKAKAAADAAVH